MFFTLVTSLLFLQPLLVNAGNDWTNACVGSCSYEAGDGLNKAWSTILIVRVSINLSVCSTLTPYIGWRKSSCLRYIGRRRMVHHGLRQFFSGNPDGATCLSQSRCWMRTAIRRRSRRHYRSAAWRGNVYPIIYEPELWFWHHNLVRRCSFCTGGKRHDFIKSKSLVQGCASYQE